MSRTVQQPEPPATVALTAAAIADVRRASPHQQQLLAAAGAGTDLVQVVIRWRGELASARLRAAWQETVRRHAELRTAFRWRDCALALAITYQHAELPWAEYDWRGLSRLAQRQQRRLFLATDRQRGFARQVPPLLRCALFGLGPARAELVVTFHRLLFEDITASPRPLAVAFSLPQPGCGQGLPASWMLDHLGQTPRDKAVRRLSALGSFGLLLEEVRRPFQESHGNPRSQHPPSLPPTGLVGLIEQQAARRPQAVAVRCGNQQLTYGALNEAANRLARQLRRAGVTEQARVALAFERSVELVIALLGILKAGAVYLPLETASPPARLASMLADAQPVLVLAQRRFRESMSGPSLDWETVWQAAADLPAANLGLPSDPDRLAYIMYTSGSTGQPKGVCITQRGIIRLAIGADYVQLGPDDNVAHTASPAFDAASFEIWAPLLVGAQITIIPEAAGLSPPALFGLLMAERVTTLFLTTAWFHQLAAQQPVAFRGLRQLLVGGERLSAACVAEVMRDYRPQRLLNMYGPTETTTFATWYEIAQVPAPEESIPIGRPIAHTSVEVRDGELWIGGAGVATGYLNRPELTVARFVIDPVTGQRLYRTGDLVRYRADGNLEFLGRCDDQVKLRGFRIEPGEIEAALNQHPGVRASAVVLRADQLVAYVVARDGQRIQPSGLREHLAAKLPGYMVPAQYVSLAQLPRGANGKLDRAALPAPGAVSSPVREPRTAIEARLTAIWRAALGVDVLGIDDNFFERGGHSLLAVRVLVEIENTLGRRLQLRTFFEAPTIAQLSRHLVTADSPAASSSIVAIQSTGTQRPLFFVHGIGGGMVWGYSNIARHLDRAQPVYVITSRWKAGDPETLPITAMAAQYVDQVRLVQPRGPYYLGGYCFGGNVAAEMARQLHQQGEQVGLLALINSEPPNGGCARPRHWRPLRAGQQACNLLYWLFCYWRWEPPHQREFRRWRWRALRRTLQGTKGHGLDDLADLAPYPPEVRRLWEIHYRALINHHPQPYPGRITLFRSRAYSPRSAFDPQYGWGPLAGGGVRVNVVPGAHDSILREPAVRILARQLQQALREAQP